MSLSPFSPLLAPIVLAWGLWCFLHSFLISPAVTRFFQRRLGAGFRFYRFGYVLFSVVTLIPLIHLTETAEQSVLFAWRGYARVVPISGIALAVVLFVGGARSYDLMELLGFRQMVSQRTAEFRESGLLAIIRHPWYAACFPLVWAQDLTTLSIQVNVVLTAYLVIGTILEERKLVAEFGAAYRDYQRRVSMFFPWKWLRSRFLGKSAGM